MFAYTADAPELRLRHFHRTLDLYLAKPPA